MSFRGPQTRALSFIFFAITRVTARSSDNFSLVRLFPVGFVPGEPVVGLARLRIANGRIGVTLCQAGKNKRLLWLEADLKGNETVRWTTPLGQEPVAMAEGVPVYAQRMGEISMLDRASGTSKPVAQTFNDRWLGTEGNTLVFAITGMNAIRMADQP